MDYGTSEREATVADQCPLASLTGAYTGTNATGKQVNAVAVFERK